MKRPALTILALAALGGCAETIAEGRVRSALVGAGLPERTADCMAGRMVDRLTIAQLRRLEALRGVDRSRAGDLTVPQYLDLVRRVGDAEVLSVTGSSAALCSMGLG